MAEEILDTREFYDQLAGEYDDMVRFRDRLTGEEEIMKNWQRRYGFRTALDAGCGSGLHTLALSAAGIKVTGVDLSAGMIQKAQENARLTDSQDVSFYRSSFSRLPDCLRNQQFDAVFCLGNTLAHCLTEEELATAIKSFFLLCRADAILVLQLLNYKKILGERQRIVACSGNTKKEYVRFYDFGGQLINFNILTIDLNNQAYRLQTMRLNPITGETLHPFLKSAGFIIEAGFGTMTFDAYNDETSKNFIVVARRANNGA